MKSVATNALPIPVKRVMVKLGHDIRAARIRRRIPTVIMAERAFISRATLNKVEKGDPSVAFGTYATVLFILGLSSKLGEMIDIAHDHTGQSLEESALPKRIRLTKSSKKPA